MFDYALERSEFENGRGFVVMRVADGQHLRWQSLPRGDGLESVNVVGERYRLDAIQDPCFAPGNEIMLEREPANQYDPNAIAVWNAARTVQAGYIPREDASRLAKKLDRGERFRVLTIWETLEGDRRTGIRLLLLGEGASCRRL
jgi:HIRAN domain-containing protein